MLQTRHVLTKVIPLVVVLVLIATACSGGNKTLDASSPTVPAAEMDCEQLGYPCDWADADGEVLS